MSKPNPILNLELLYTNDVVLQHALISEILQYTESISRDNQVTYRNFIHLIRLMVDKEYRAQETALIIARNGRPWRWVVPGYDPRLIFTSKEGIVKHLKRLAHPDDDKEYQVIAHEQYKLLRRLYIADSSLAPPP